MSWLSEALAHLSVCAQPSEDTDAGNEPEHLLELEWQADQVIVDACGQHSVVSYATTAD